MAAQGEILHTCKIVYKKKQHQLKVTAEELFLVPIDRKGGAAQFINTYDCYGAVAGRDGLSLELFTLVAGSKGKRSRENHVFVCSSKEEAAQCLAVLHAVITGTKIGEPIHRRRILILINPFSGTKKAVQIYAEQVKPVLDRALVDVTVIQTTHAGHATEYMQSVDIAQYDGYATISGDGLLHEALNGLMARPDRAEAMKKPLGVIPGGTGNSLAFSLGLGHVLAATLAVVKGHTMTLDLMGVRQGGRAPYYAFLLVMWGLVADIDIESEKYRWAGAARFTMSGIGRILNLRKYSGRLSYKPWFADTAAADTAAEAAHAEFPAPPAAWLPTDDATPALDRPGWHTIEGDFVTVSALNTAFQNEDTLMAPYSAVNDGCFDLMYIMGDISSTKLAGMFLDLDSGEHVRSPFVHYVKARAMCLEPRPRTGIIDVDGEHVETSPIVVQTLPAYASICVSPIPLNMPPYKDVLPRGGLRVPSSQEPDPTAPQARRMTAPASTRPTTASSTGTATAAAAAAPAPAAATTAAPAGSEDGAPAPATVAV
eukprot:m.164580 g.164580  ORF g.164580 m.164580 type:complete len:541 (+) comp15225_c0_seq3:2695-4317(+)